MTALSGPVGGSFEYDAVGRRRLRTVGSNAKQYLYDGLNPVQELASGTPVANLLTGLGSDEYFTRTDGAGGLNYLADADHGVGKLSWGTSAQVGGIGRARIVNNGNGTATFTIRNVAGTHSFFLHAVPNRKATKGMMSNITQTFSWTEAVPCLPGRK